MMKKLLLILICLFVSFEVKSESDDLSGKQLVCEGSNYINGYKFLDNFKVKIMTINKEKGTIIEYPKFYSTSPVEIEIGVKSINRLTLKEGKSNRCKLIKENFETYMNNRVEIILNDIESKRKI